VESGIYYIKQGTDEDLQRPRTEELAQHNLLLARKVKVPDDWKRKGQNSQVSYDIHDPVDEIEDGFVDASRIRNG
jgi:hypothetical protein